MTSGVTRGVAAQHLWTPSEKRLLAAGYAQPRGSDNEFTLEQRR